MPRSYRRISQYENEILELKSKGYGRKAIANKLGLKDKVSIAIQRLY